MANDIDIAGLREMEKKATKDKWWVERCQEHGVPLLKYKWDDVPTWIAEGSVRENSFNDFRFIAALRNAASDLLTLAEIGKAAVEEHEANFADDSGPLRVERWRLARNKLEDVCVAYLARKDG